MAGAAAVVMIVKIRSGGDEVEENLHLQWNQKYLLETGAETTPPNQLMSSLELEGFPPSSPTYALSVDKPPKNTQIGWVFGSDEEHCDFRLAKGNETAVSGCHFTITFDLGCMHVKMINLSQHYTGLEFHNSSERYVLSGPSQGSKASQCIPPGGIWIVSAGLIRLAFEAPHEALSDSILGTVCSSFPSQIIDTNAWSTLLQDGSASDGRDRETTPLSAVGMQKRGEFLTKMGGRLGTGGYGVVDKAAACKTGALVAIKTNPNIVKLIDYQLSPITLILEYQELGDLHQQARQKDYSRFEVILMLTQQLQALEYLHAMGVTHRDVKPTNILVASRSPFLITKLSDFGLSTSAKEFGSPFGTITYVAPEAITGVGNNLLDIWALGNVALEYTHGRPRPINEGITAWGQQVAR
ncbi:MAG: hypothetical protein Q9174_006764, partial [Haloplaca sp. 1 TL-2023]